MLNYMAKGDYLDRPNLIAWDLVKAESSLQLVAEEEIRDSRQERIWHTIAGFEGRESHMPGTIDL